jgi:hypothetical protein
MNEYKEITLPYELALSGLSLEEIGAIFKSFSIMKMTDSEVENSMSSDESKYYQIIQDLSDREIISVEYDLYNKPTMIINLEKKKEPFWEVYEHDDNDNPTYYHYSGYGDEPFKYMIHPTLANMQIEWHDCSDVDLNLGYLEPFKSLEEAEKYYQELIDKAIAHRNDMKENQPQNQFWVYDETSSLCEFNHSYIHRYEYEDGDGDYDMFHIRSMRTVNDNMWKLSTPLGPEDGPELFTSKEEAQEYCEKLINQENLKHNVSR